MEELVEVSEIAAGFSRGRIGSEAFGWVLVGEGAGVVEPVNSDLAVSHEIHAEALGKVPRGAKVAVTFGVGRADRGADEAGLLLG